MTTQALTQSAVQRRPIRLHHVVAVVMSAALSAIALFDAATHGITGRSSVFSDDSSQQGIATVGGILHGLAYLALAFVLIRERPLFVGRLLRGTRFALLGALALFAGLFLIATPIVFLTTGTAALPEGDTLGVALGILATTAFVGMLVGGVILGLTQIRRATLGLGGRVLIAMAPVFGVTVLLGLMASPWAHPGYLEATFNLGISLIGVGLVARVPSAS